MEATYWDQRMRQIWLKTGDKNTKQFHLSVQQRRRKNQISCIQNNNQEWSTHPNDISQELIFFFRIYSLKMKLFYHFQIFILRPSLWI